MYLYGYILEGKVYTAARLGYGSEYASDVRLPYERFYG